MVASTTSRTIYLFFYQNQEEKKAIINGTGLLRTCEIDLSTKTVKERIEYKDLYGSACAYVHDRLREENPLFAIRITSFISQRSLFAS